MRLPLSIVIGLIGALGLSGCGPDTLTAAATAAATEAAAAKQAQEQKAALEANIKAVQDATLKQAASIGDQADKAAQ